MTYHPVRLKAFQGPNLPAFPPLLCPNIVHVFCYVNNLRQPLRLLTTNYPNQVGTTRVLRRQLLPLRNISLVACLWSDAILGRRRRPRQ